MVKKHRKSSLTQAYMSFGLLFMIVIIGITGYRILGFTFVEAFYQTVITIATVGFQEVHTLSNSGMIFTAFLIVFSIGIFAYAVSTFTRHIIEGVYRNYYKDNIVKRKIDRLSGHVIICGYGRNGKQAALELIEHKVPILIIEKNPDLVQTLRETPGMLYIEGDAGNEEILEQASIKTAKALISTLPVDADNLFVVLTAREFNPDLTIISRASLDRSDVKLKRAGATNVIMPDKIGGKRMAKLVAQPDIVEFIDYMLLQSAENAILEEISCEKIASFFSGKSIQQLDIRNVSGANIIGMKRGDNSILINPLPETLLTPSDKLFVLGSRKQIDSLVKLIASEIE